MTKLLFSRQIVGVILCCTNLAANTNSSQGISSTTPNMSQEKSAELS